MHSSFMPCSANKEFIFSPFPSSPIAPNKVVVNPNEIRLLATFAAPPKLNVSFSNFTTGTGASGDILSAEPQI